MHNSPTFDPTFYRTYSRKVNGVSESWAETVDRSIGGLEEIGQFTEEESILVRKHANQLTALPSGRWLWVGGTKWIQKPENFPGGFNCSSTSVDSWEAFGLMMDLAMQGCGTGAILEPKYINQLPIIRNRLNVEITDSIGVLPPSQRLEDTLVFKGQHAVSIKVGDSRQGWVKAYQTLLELSSDETVNAEINVLISLSSVRQAGEKLQGFGGTANPVKLTDLFFKVASILNRAKGRKLTSVECCLLIDEAALVVVAGNLRRSAGMRQGISSDELFAVAKDNLWAQDTEGNWRIDPDRDALRMANHTRVFHHQPTEQECVGAVRKQYFSGEGAIQYAPEAIARANADILGTSCLKSRFIELYITSKDAAFGYLQGLSNESDLDTEYRISIMGTNPCGEIILRDNFCNLSEVHLNQIDPFDFAAQEEAFKVAALCAAALLKRNFTQERYQKSRELDPIVGVSFTGLFDFFVNAFGVDWLKWWEAGRPDQWDGITPKTIDTLLRDLPEPLREITTLWDQGAGEFEGTEEWWGADGVLFKALEKAYLEYWRDTATQAVWKYCDRHNLKRPNRCTTVQPAGTKSLLTGASAGWHPPKAQRYIRRITFGKNDPVALAGLDYGYSVVPSQSDKDENGNLLNDPFDPRCTEWLLEIPIEVPWANLPGADQIHIEKFSALAQFDFYMQVQRYYTTHNTSGTIELREHEIEALGSRIYEAIQNDEGYISSALLARFDDLQTFPRLPFEPISKEQYAALSQAVVDRRKTDDFLAALNQHMTAQNAKVGEYGAAGCDSDKCMFPVAQPTGEEK